MLAREHVSMQSTSAHEHVNTHARHVGTSARESVRYFGTWALEHARQVSTWARKACNLADSEVALYLYKTTIRPCMECFLVWSGALTCYLEWSGKLQKRISRSLGPSFATSLESLIYRQNVASLSLFYRYCFRKCSSELAQLVPLNFFRGRSTRYSDKLHDFSVTFPRCCEDVYGNRFFPRISRWHIL